MDNESSHAWHKKFQIMPRSTPSARCACNNTEEKPSNDESVDDFLKQKNEGNDKSFFGSFSDISIKGDFEMMHRTWHETRRSAPNEGLKHEPATVEDSSFSDLLAARISSPDEVHVDKHSACRASESARETSHDRKCIPCLVSDSRGSSDSSGNSGSSGSLRDVLSKQGFKENRIDPFCGGVVANGAEIAGVESGNQKKIGNGSFSDIIAGREFSFPTTCDSGCDILNKGAECNKEDQKRRVAVTKKCDRNTGVDRLEPICGTSVTNGTEITEGENENRKEIGSGSFNDITTGCEFSFHTTCDSSKSHFISNKGTECNKEGTKTFTATEKIARNTVHVVVAAAAATTPGLEPVRDVSFDTEESDQNAHAGREEPAKDNCRRKETSFRRKLLRAKSMPSHMIKYSTFDDSPQIIEKKQRWNVLRATLEEEKAATEERAFRRKTMTLVTDIVEDDISPVPLSPHPLVPDHTFVEYEKYQQQNKPDDESKAYGEITRFEGVETVEKSRQTAAAAQLVVHPENEGTTSAVMWKVLS